MRGFLRRTGLFLLFVVALALITLPFSMARGQERTKILDPHLDSLFPAHPTNYLTDLSGKVTNADAVNLRLKAIREQDSLSLVAVVLNTTGQRSDADVAREIGRSWMVAQAGAIGSPIKNTGGVILLVLDSHKCRVEVATGSEGYMTDFRAAEACRSATDNFRAGDFGGGILKIANTFDDFHKGGVKAATEGRAPKAPEPPTDYGFIFSVLGLVAAIIGIAVWLVHRHNEKVRIENERKRELKRLNDKIESLTNENTRLLKDLTDERKRRYAAEDKLEQIRLEEERKERERKRKEAEEKERRRWNALTPEQQAAELAEKERIRKEKEEQERLRRIQEEKERVARQAREAEEARLRKIREEEDRKRREKEAEERRRREAEEESRRRSSYSSYDNSSSSWSSSSDSSSWSSGGSDSFGGGGGGSSW